MKNAPQRAHNAFEPERLLVPTPAGCYADLQNSSSAARSSCSGKQGGRFFENVEIAEGRSPVASNTSNRWTPEEEERLKSLIEANTSILLIAAKLKRSVEAVKARAIKLRIRRPK
jgi:hypothetical protein